MPAIERSSGRRTRSRSASDAAGAIAAQKLDLDGVHRIDVGVAQSDGLLDDCVSIEEVLRTDDSPHGVDGEGVLLGDRREEARVVHEVEVPLGDLEARLRQSHLEVLDERPEEGPLAVEAAQIAHAHRREGAAAPVPGREEAAVLRPGEDPRDGAERREVVVGGRTARRAGSDLEQRELVDRRELPEEGEEAIVPPDEIAVPLLGATRHRLEQLPRAVRRRRPGYLGKRRQERCGHRRLEVAIREAREAVLEGHGLTLLGQLQTTGRMPRRLGEDRGMRRAASTSGAAAAAVEDRQLHVSGCRELDERALGLVDLPLRGEVAPVLARVGVAHHHLEPPVAGDAGIVEERFDDSGCGSEVGDRLEERDHGERLVGHVERAQHVLRAARPRDDDGVERLGSVPRTGTRDRREGLSYSSARPAEIVGVDAYVELREVESEQLDATAKRGEPPVRNACRAPLAQAAVDHVEIGGQLGADS